MGGGGGGGGGWGVDALIVGGVRSKRPIIEGPSA